MRWAEGLVIASLVVLSSVATSDSANILALFNLNGKSHYVMFESLLKNLAARGHSVYVVGHFPQKKPIPNFTDISVEGSLPGLVNNFTIDVARGFGYINLWDFIWRDTLHMCQTVLEHPKVQKLLSSEQKFDLMITEIFGPDCFVGLAHKWNIPHISMISSVVFPWANDRVGNPDHPAYIPNYFLPYSQNMNLLERLTNTIFTVGLKLGFDYFGQLKMDELGKKYYGQDLPPLSKLVKRTSLILVNSHFSINIPRPAVPAFIEVGGIHIGEPKKLPQDIQAFMDNAKDGVIYFSLGSLVRGETLPPETIQIFVQVFSSLPQRVLWKIDDIGQLPNNIKTSKWLPQLEILSHPKMKAFITHGGLMGTQEGVYTGVPMIGIPLFADQFLNIINLMSRGVAVMVEYDSVSRETITHALDTVLHDPRYMENAKHLSQLFRDRPQTALETATFWTEYVIRHRGAPHIKTASVDMSLYQYLLLDVIAVIILALAISLSIIFLLLRKIVHLCFTKKPKKVKSS